MGAYHLRRRLGSGATCDVYLASRAADPPGASDLVVKRFRPEHAENLEACALFLREAQLLPMFVHPGLPRFVAAGEDGSGGRYLVREYAPGASLAELLAARCGAVPLDAACGIVLQLCDALHHVHECAGLGIVHRDVAPQNVIVAADGHVRLIDLGVATVAGDDDATPRGSVGTMAPEQIRGEIVDRRADVFSVGAIMYEMSVGVPPFAGSVHERMTATVERDVTRPSARVAAYPDALEKVVLGALCRDRERRTASARELARGVDDFCARAEIVASPATVGRWVQQAP